MFIHNGILCSCLKWWNCVVCYNLEGTRGLPAEWNKPGGEGPAWDDATQKLVSRETTRI